MVNTLPSYFLTNCIAKFFPLLSHLVCVHIYVCPAVHSNFIYNYLIKLQIPELYLNYSFLANCLSGIFYKPHLNLSRRDMVVNGYTDYIERQHIFFHPLPPPPPPPLLSPPPPPPILWYLVPSVNVCEWSMI